jgi:hypothetical protein
MMRPAITERAFSHAGTDYAKGERITLADNQFDDWKGVGLVKAPPRTTKPKPPIDGAEADA